MTKNKDNKEMDDYFNNTSLIRVIYKWRKHLIVIAVVAGILGAIFSMPFFITPLYKSEAIAYPANVSSYSDESETEQMLQILQSQSIMDSIVKKFNLMEHYKISFDYVYWKTALLREYREKVKVTKTQYEAVSIVVMDKDPQVACAMVNEILHQYNLKIGSMHKSKRFEVVKMYESQLNTKKRFIDSLQMRAQEIATKYGIVEVKSQTREIARAELGTYSGHGANSQKLKTMKENMETYAPELVKISDLIEMESQAYTDIKLDYEQEWRFVKTDLTYSNILSEPFVADKKSYPVRWVVVALSMSGALLFSILAIFIFENKRLLPLKKH
ncbi:MAG: hypothetical protein LBM67_06660 [Lentimicrobiaceae bacterium]|jgi:capsular polysaccharide biosynthesis protein|nr:hypothetical protein [Lentimicrobiaceae bacterium]